MKKRGFSLIEITVVVLVLGILAALVIPAVDRVLIKARDARRKADLMSIQLALESYFDDNGYYPQSSCGWDCSGYRHSTSGAQWIPEIVTYLSSGVVPLDPRNNANPAWTGGNYCYTYGNVWKNSVTCKPSYDLIGQLENTRDPDRCAVKCYTFTSATTSINAPWCTNVAGNPVTCTGSYSGQIYDVSPLTPP